MEIWTAATPNGWKVSIMIEELIEAGVKLPECQVRSINLAAGEQFTPEFTARNPNQKIPVLIDGDLSIMESCAILQYLAEKHPTDLLPSGAARWDVLQWLYWQAANVGPVFGNKLSYTRYMDDVDPEQKAHPLERFGKEGRRLVAVLGARLEGRDYVCGDAVHHRRHRPLSVGARLEVEQDQHHRPAQRRGLGEAGAGAAGRGARLGLGRAQG